MSSDAGSRQWENPYFYQKCGVRVEGNSPTNIRYAVLVLVHGRVVGHVGEEKGMISDLLLGLKRGAEGEASVAGLLGEKVHLDLYLRMQCHCFCHQVGVSPLSSVVLPQ